MRLTVLLTVLFVLPDMAAGSGRGRPGRAAVHPAAVLVYHHFLSDEEARRNPKRLDDLTMSASQFTEQLDLLARLKATPISMEELRRHISGERVAPPRSYAIVIDDGYESTYRVAWPILKSRGMPAAVALMVRATEDPAEWARRYPGSTLHLTWAQIAEMQKPVQVDGKDRVLVSIESHTFDRHMNLRGAEKKLSGPDRATFSDELLADLVLARDTIRTRTGGLSKADFLIWPHGTASPTLLEAARQAGHIGTFVGPGDGVRSRTTDPMRIPRIHAGTGVRGLRNLENALESFGFLR